VQALVGKAVRSPMWAGAAGHRAGWSRARQPPSSPTPPAAPTCW